MKGEQPPEVKRMIGLGVLIAIVLAAVAYWICIALGLDPVEAVPSWAWLLASATSRPKNYVYNARKLVEQGEVKSA